MKKLKESPAESKEQTAKPRIVEVREIKIREKAPPNEDDYEFLETFTCSTCQRETEKCI